MGQKVNPVCLRLGIVRGWDSNWYGGKDFSNKLVEDQEIRKYINARIPKGGISKIIIERTIKRITITVHTARPGVVIGKRGEDVEKLRDDVKKIMGVPVHINIAEIKKPELDAKLVAEGVAGQLVKRVMFRRAMKRAVQNAMRQGAEGIKIAVAGRLGGAEIAREEWYREGRVPLHTFRADIDYATSEASTTYGIIGVKVWIFKGEVLGGLPTTQEQAPAAQPKKKGRNAKREG